MKKLKNSCIAGPNYCFFYEFLFVVKVPIISREDLAKSGYKSEIKLQISNHPFTQ
jgi:hypothetical protein